MRRLLWILLFLIPSVGYTAPEAATYSSPPIRVALVSPSPQDHQFWQMLVNFAQVAASDLNIELEVIYSNNESADTTAKTLAVLNRKSPPHYLIFNYFYEHGERILKAAEKAKVHSIIINTDIPPAQREHIGKPQQHYHYWLGRIVPDDQRAAYELTKFIVEEAKREKNLEHLNVVAFSGNSESSSSLLRNQGLMLAINSFSNMHLKALHFTDWSTQQTDVIAKQLLADANNIHAVWGASDALAITASKHLREAKAEHSILSAGFDWSHEGLSAIANGQLTVSAGGQFMDAALALVLIYDHAHGFRANPETTDISRALALIYDNNLMLYRELLDQSLWPEISFRPLTHTHSQHNGRYLFDTQPLIRTLFQDSISLY